MKKYDHIIVGASQAGLTAARTLREEQPKASILIINGEDRHPYKRTHLTKKLATGFTTEELALYPPAWYTEMNLERRDSPAIELNPLNKTLVLETGERVMGHRILLAVGALPLIPSIPGKEEILHLRKADETERIRERLINSNRVLIIGQGVEGVEMAEQCRLMGLDVISTSTSSRLMSRWLDKELSRRLERLLKSKGVLIRHSEEPISLEKKGENYRLEIRKNEKTAYLSAQVILASIGIRGDVSLLKPHNREGLLGEKGILTNEYMESIYKDIYAAGDVVEMPPGWASGLWHSAEKQGQMAALNMLGIKRARENYPVRLKCEVFGDFFFSMAYDRVLKERGNLKEWTQNKEKTYIRVFFKEGKAIGALMQGKKEKGKALSRLVVEGAEETAFKTLIES